MPTFGTVEYPAALDTVDSLGQASNRGTSTLLVVLLAAATTMNVTSAAAFAVSGAVTVENEIIYYTGRDTTLNTLTGLIRGREGTTDATHASAVAVEQRITARYLSVLRDAIIAAETKIGISADTPVASDFLKGTGAGISAWAALTSAEVTTALGYTPGAGGSLQNAATKTAAYTLTASDELILANAASAALPLTLPLAASQSLKAYRVKKIDSSANLVTILTAGVDLLDGSTSLALADQWTAVEVASDGAAWYVIGSHGAFEIVPDTGQWDFSSFVQSGHLLTAAF